MSTTTFGERLKTIRLQHNMNARQFAQRCGLNFREVYYYEDGGRQPTLMKAAKIASALGLSLDWLTGLKD